MITCIGYIHSNKKVDNKTNTERLPRNDTAFNSNDDLSKFRKYIIQIQSDHPLKYVGNFV